MIPAKWTFLIFVIISAFFSDATGKYLDEINEKGEFINQDTDSWEDPDPCDNLKCFNGGYCDNGTCVCVDGYMGKNCGGVPKKKCIEELEICVLTGGVCISMEDEEIECKCPKDKEFNEEEGCKDNFCKVVCGDKEGVVCNGDKTKTDKITCTCEEDGKAFDTNTKECKDDKCFTHCGIPYFEKDSDVKCVNGPFGNVQCQCKEPNEAFDPEDKICKTDYCKEKCGVTTRVKCEGHKFEESEVLCVCIFENEDFNSTAKKCQINYCKKVCGSDERIECDGDPYKMKKTTDCRCDDDNYQFKNKGCIEKCSEDEDCEHGGKCKGAEGSKLCECSRFTEGDKCEVLSACVTGKYKNCKGDNGNCVFNKDKPEKAECECPEGKKVPEALGYCIATCEEDKDCEGSNRKCNNDKFCVCKPGYEGEGCNVVTGCPDLEEKCEEIGTKCVLDENNLGKGKCECKDGYTYNRETNKCQDPYCYPYSPCKEGECKYNHSIGAGYCQCTENKFYNYKTERCEDLPKCLLRKFPCSVDEVCENGECRCRYKVREGEKCERKFCASNPCFPGSMCQEDGTCHCEEGKYYRDRKCQDAKCLKDFKKSCPCPAGTKRKEEGDECVPSKEEEECSKDCGYGICIKKDNKETCKCFNAIADSYRGKCILKKSYCAGGQLQRDLMRCFCAGQYTQAEDGTTCRLKTCDDYGVKKECASMGGECEMKWKEGGFSCRCPEGYVVGTNRKCTDVCSIERNIKACAEKGMFCYNNMSSRNLNTGICGCPPTFKGDTCSAKAENVYLIKNIYVLKKRYEMKSGINKVLLSADLMKSMEISFNGALFESGYLYDYRIEGSVIKCSIWINFNSAPPKTELDKIKLVPKTILKACNECEESAIIWPPSILLSERGLQEAEYTKLEFCSNEVKNLLCGKGAMCKDNKCTCDEGFKLIENSIQRVSDYEIQRCEDIDECALGIDICSKNENTICVNTFGSYKCVCKEGFKKRETPKEPETDKSDCYDMCTPSPCIKGNCYLTGKSFDCKCEPGYGGPFCNRLDDNYISSKKGTVVVGSVLGVTLLVLTVAFLYYVIRMKRRSHSGDYKPSSRQNQREMTERRRM